MSSSYRVRDSRVESEIAIFLDKHLYPADFTKAERVTDKSIQLQGIDVIADFDGHTRLLIDEKAATHYINKNIPTFAFELFFHDKLGILRPGWLFDDEKKSTHYLLMWLNASKDWNLRASDIKKIECFLIDRQKIKSLLASYGLVKSKLERINDAIKKRNETGALWKSTKRPFYIYNTEHLVEKPINVIIYKNQLKNISLKTWELCNE